jgi:hypothetical protein
MRVFVRVGTCQLILIFPFLQGMVDDALEGLKHLFSATIADVRYGRYVVAVKSRRAAYFGLCNHQPPPIHPSSDQTQGFTEIPPLMC